MSWKMGIFIHRTTDHNYASYYYIDHNIITLQLDWFPDSEDKNQNTDEVYMPGSDVMSYRKLRNLINTTSYVDSAYNIDCLSWGFL